MRIDSDSFKFAEKAISPEDLKKLTKKAWDRATTIGKAVEQASKKTANSTLRFGLKV